MNTIETIRNNIIRNINENNYNELKNYVINNNINLKELNNGDFDLLIYSIENLASSNIINFIIEQCPYKNLNYAFYSPNYSNIFSIIDETNASTDCKYLSYKVPLFLTIFLENFKLADILIKHNADINYKLKCSDGQEINIIHILLYGNKFIDILNFLNIRYILLKGFNVRGISNDILNKLISNEYNNDVSEIIFNYYIYDNDFILKMIGFYKNNIALSKQQLFDIISMEKGKITINEATYCSALKGNNLDGIKLLLDNDSDDEESILYKINKYGILEKAISNNNYLLTKKILTYKNINMNQQYIENICMKCVENGNADILILIIDKLNSNSYDFEKNFVNLQKIVLEVSRRRDENLMNLLIQLTWNINIYDIDSFNKWILSGKNVDNQFLILILNLCIKLKKLHCIYYIINDQYQSNEIIINGKDKNGEYPILNAFYEITYHQSSYYTSISIFKYLLEYGANCNIKDKNGKPLFLLALLHQEYIVVMLLLKESSGIIKEDILGNTHPLINAICNNQMDVVLSWINENRNIDINLFSNNIDNNYSGYGFTLLILSYLLNHNEIFQILLKSSTPLQINEMDIHGYSILHYAIMKEDIGLTERLIEMGADVNYKVNQYNLGNSALDIAICIKNVELFSIVLQSKTLDINIPNKRGDIPIMTMFRVLNNESCNEEVEMVNSLIKHGANINFKDEFGNPLLLYAIYYRSLPLVKLLIENGADINFFIKTCNGRNKSLLMYAIEINDSNIIQYLIRYKNIQFMGDDSISDLIAIMENGNLDILQYLDKLNCNTNIIVKVLKEIIIQNKFELLKKLVQHHLDINIKDENGDNLLVIAIRHSNRQIVDYLLNHGANIYNINKYGESVIDVCFEYYNFYYKNEFSIFKVSGVIYKRIKRLYDNNDI